MNILKNKPTTNEWGPYFWYVIHMVCFNYPNNPNDYHKMTYKNFLEAIGNVLPCKKCRQHYQTHISKVPVTPFLDNNQLLNQWVIDLHNSVNMSLSKHILSYEQVYHIYNNLEVINPFKNHLQDVKIKKHATQTILRNKYYGLIILLTLFIIWLIYMKKKYYYDY